MAIEAVRKYFKTLGIDDRIQEFDVSSATVELAAKALKVEPQRIAKTMAFKQGEGCMLIVTSGDAKIDNSKFKKKFSIKAKMLKSEEVDEFVGHSVGGVCPFAVKSEMPVYLDTSLKRFNTVFPACGSSNSAVELTCDELYEYSNSVGWVDVCKINE